MATLQDHVAKMVDAGVPEGDILAFVDKFDAEQPPQTEKPDYWRGVAQTTGAALAGLGAGAVTIPNPIPGDEVVAVPAAMAWGDATGGMVYDWVKGLINPEEMPTPTEQFSRAATDASLDVAGGVVGGKIAEKAVDVAKPLLSPIKSFVKSRVGVPGISTLDDIAGLEAQGFRADAGMLGNPEAKAFSASMRRKPATGSIFGEVDAHNYATGQQVNQSIADSLGPNRTPYEIGQMVQQDARAARKNWHDVNENLWNRVGDFVPEGAAIPANNVIGQAQEILEAAQKTPYAADALAPVAKQAQLVLDSIDENGLLSKDALRSIKATAKGAYKKLSHEATDIDRVRMAFERAADRDLGEAAEAYGKEKAVEARTMAKDWYKRGMGHKKEGEVGLLDEVATLVKNPEPETIYRQLIRGGKPQAEKMMSVMNMVSADTQAAIRSRAYRDLGLAAPGAQSAAGGDFSFARFLTNYNKMRKEAPGMEDVLFGPARKELDKLVKNADFFKSLDSYANSSQTSVNLAWDNLWKPIFHSAQTGALVGTGVGMSLEGLVKGAATGTALQATRLGTQRRVARLMTDPRFVRWLVDSTKRTAINSKSYPRSLARLAFIASSESAHKENENLADDMLWYLGELGADTKKITTKTGKLKSIEVK